MIPVAFGWVNIFVWSLIASYFHPLKAFTFFFEPFQIQHIRCQLFRCQHSLPLKLFIVTKKGKWLNVLPVISWQLSWILSIDDSFIFNLQSRWWNNNGRHIFPLKKYLDLSHLSSMLVNVTRLSKILLVGTV